MSQFFKSLLFLVLFSSSSFAESVLPDNIPAYYGAEFAQEYQANHLSDLTLMKKLFKVISNGHAPVGYDTAKKLIFGKLFLQMLPTGEYAVKDVYCEHTFTDLDFGGIKAVGPMKAPIDGKLMNTEHTWPQSKFVSTATKETQKSDLHHLYPTDSDMNNRRGNYDFGNVISPKTDLKCPIGKLGKPAEGGSPVFEAPLNHRGNVARSIFYFAVRYKARISPSQEAALRKWNDEDPVDQAERDRNDQIQKEQGNRNPFVDIPTLPNHISSFNVKFLTD